MRMRPAGWMACLCAALVLGVGAAALGAAAEKAPDKAPDPSTPPATAGKDEPAKTSGQEGATAKIEKQINSMQDRMSELQTQEFKISTEVMRIQMAAQQALGTIAPDKARDDLAKGATKKELVDYRAALVNCAGQWKGFADRYMSVVRTGRGLEAMREKAPPELQTKIDEVARKAEDKYRTLMERVADLYEKVGDYRSALQINLSLYQAVPENKRAGERQLKEMIATLYERVGDGRNALTMLKGIMDGLPEKDRYKDKKLAERVAGLYEKAGDTRTAFQILKAAVEAVPEKDRYSKERKMAEHLGDLYAKGGDFQAAVGIYNACLNGIAADKRDTDGKGLRTKIKDNTKK